MSLFLSLLVLKTPKVYKDESLIRAKQYETELNYEKAKEEYLKLSKKYKGKDLAIVYENLADLYFFYYYPDSNKLALDYITKAYKLDKKNDRILYKVALYYEAVENYKEASKYYEELAIKFQKSEFFNDAMNGVERIFPKNYKDELAAKYDNEEHITLMELEKEIENQPVFLRSKYETYDGKKELINQIIENRILLKRALNKGYHLPRQFREKLYESLKDELARVYYAKYIAEKVKVDSSEVKQFYEKNKENYRIWGFVNLKLLKWDDNLNLPNDSIFNAQSKIMTYYENSPDSLIYKSLSKKDTGKIFIETIKDTLYAVKIIKIQEPGYTKLEDIYNSIESNLRFEKERKTWETLLDSILIKYSYKTIDKDTTSKEIPETLAIIGTFNTYITKADYQNYLNKVPTIYRRAYSTKEGAYELVKIYTQRELIFRDAIAYKRIFTISDGYTTFKKNFENLLINELKDEVLKDVSVSQDEIRNYYQENREKLFRIPANAKIRKLTLDNEKEARRIYNIISKNPQKFDSLAKIYAKEQEEKQFGGLMFVNEFDTLLFNQIKNLKVGKPSLIKIDKEWIIVSVQEFNPARYRELNEVEEQIRQLLLNDKREETWNSYREKLKEEAKIEILIKEENKETKEGG